MKPNSAPKVPFMGKLGEKCHRKSPENHHNNTYKSPKDKNDMTLIIGARCKDGVVIIGDKKVSEGTSSFPGKKITIMPFGVAIGGAGMTDLIDKFGIRLKNYFNQRTIEIDGLKQRGEIPRDAGIYDAIDDFVNDCEAILKKIKEDYREISPSLGLLMGFRNGNDAELHYLDMFYGVDSVRKSFMSIGSGSPYANFFLRELWDENLTMKQMAKIGVFIINYISEKELDDAVGYGYQIVEIPDLILNMKDKEGDIKEFNLIEEQKIKLSTEEFHLKVRELKNKILG